jgi:hypothetical protein
MLLFIEIALLVCGIYSIFSAKVPSFIVGGGKYQVEGMAARLFGVLLILPLPIAFIGSFLFVLLLGNEGTGYAIILEIVTVLVVAISAIVLVRIIGKRVEPVTTVEAIIAKKSQGALMYGIFSITGFAALICCPLAIIYSNQAIKLIDENRVGEQHRSKAKLARVIASVATLLWVIAIACYATFMLMVANHLLI